MHRTKGTDEYICTRTRANRAKFLAELQPFDLTQVGQMIAATVDFPASAEQHRTAVKQGVDAELDSLKQNYDGMDSLLTRLLEVLTQDLPEWAQHYVANCIFFPQIGFLTVVPLEPDICKGRYEGEGIENDVWEQKFISNDMGYYKNRHMKEMDDHFGDLYGMICGKSGSDPVHSELNLEQTERLRSYTSLQSGYLGTRSY